MGPWLLKPPVRTVKVALPIRPPTRRSHEAMPEASVKAVPPGPLQEAVGPVAGSRPVVTDTPTPGSGCPA